MYYACRPLSKYARWWPNLVWCNLDTNAPEEDHWWAIMAGEVPIPDHIPREQATMLVKPDNWSFFTQPAAMEEKLDDKGEVSGYEMNKQAENARNILDTYYPNLIRGKTKSWIDVYVMNRLGMIQEGKPVYPDFLGETHIAQEEIPIAMGVPLYIGIDFGLTICCICTESSRSMVGSIRDSSCRYGCSKICRTITTRDKFSI